MSTTYPEEQEEEASLRVYCATLEVQEDVDERTEDRAKSFARTCVMLLLALQVRKTCVDRSRFCVGQRGSAVAGGLPCSEAPA